MGERIGIKALERAKELLGSELAIADVVGVKQPSVNYILNSGKRVPAEWCIPLERATAAKGMMIGRHEFRPDIYPVESPAIHVVKNGNGSVRLPRESAPAIPSKPRVRA